MMNDRLRISHLTFDGAATYQIRVSGHLESNWRDRMAGMSVRRFGSENEPGITMLEGELIDQAALAGLLMMLYEMHLPVLSVECLSVG